jgi:hypothetical protein
MNTAAPPWVEAWQILRSPSMRRRLLVAGAIITLAGAGAAHATTVGDPTGDFLASFVGSQDPDLDVTSFGVSYNAATTTFTLNASLAGTINPALQGLYVIGVNTGTGVIAPFGGIGEPNVVFNQAVIVQKTGAAALGANSLTATIAGDSFSVLVPLGLLPSTGFTPENYGWNLWPRIDLSNNSVIADFAPQNALLTAGVPEPSTWALMFIGFGALGAFLRRRRAAQTTAQPA